MFKNGLKNYLNCLKYYFIPLGIFSVFVVLGLSLSTLWITSAINLLVNQIKASISSAAEADWVEVLTKFLLCVEELDWNRPQQALSIMFTNNWFYNTFKVVLQEVFGDPNIIDTYKVLIDNTISSITKSVIFSLVLMILGLVIGYFALKFAVRKNVTKQTIRKMILFSLLDALIFGLLAILCNLFANINKWLAFGFLIVLILLSGFFVLVEAYLIYGVKKIKFKEVANAKNVLLLYAVNIIVFLITIAITALLLLIFNKIIFFGIYVTIPFIEIGICVGGSNAEGYVASLVNEKEQITKPKKKQIKE